MSRLQVVGLTTICLRHSAKSRQTNQKWQMLEWSDLVQLWPVTSWCMTSHPAVST